MHGAALARTPLFLTYDEHGGYYDHVPPPRAITPDDIPPLTSTSGRPRRRATTATASACPLSSSRRTRGPDYVSHVVHDHTSITRFIETKWNLGALTFRDANADDMTDYFDFSRPRFRTPPPMPAAPSTAPGLRRCKAAGQSPPRPSAGEVGA